MIDEKIKQAWKYITIAYSSSNHRILAAAYVQAEARARMSEAILKDGFNPKTLGDHVAEVEAELSK